MFRKGHSGFSAVGAASLLVIFASLCLVVFALLALSTVRADLSLSDSTAAGTVGYYEADAAAEKTLSLLRSGEIPEGVTEENGIFTYAHSISETQTLVVEVKVSGEDYTILRWQAVSVADWQASDSLPVWDGEMKEGS